MNHSLLPKAANANLPATYEAAKLALSESSRIDECKDWSDKMQALASYARQSEDKEMETHAMRIRARAIRRCGELLKEIEKQQGGDRKSQEIKEGVAAPFDSPRQAAAKNAGLSKDQAKTAIRVANVPSEIFEKQIESTKPPTITKLAEQGKTPAKSIPIYEKLGMTKEAFQAGMYFRGDVSTFIKAIRAYNPELTGRIARAREALTKLEAKAAFRGIIDRCQLGNEG